MLLKQPAWKIFLALAILCALTAEVFQHVIKRSPEKQVEYAQQKLLDLEKKMVESLAAISTFTTDSQFHEFFIHTSQQDPGFSFFYFENGTLRQWSDNEIVLGENAAARNIAPGPVLSLPDGTYEAFENNSGAKKFIGLILLHKSFSYENRYLKNHFNPLFKLDDTFRISSGSGDYTIKSSAGTRLLSLQVSHSVPDELPFKTPAWFYLSAFFFLLTSLLAYFQKSNAGFMSVLLTALLLFLLRYLMILVRLPGELYYNDFFSPKMYGSSFFFNSPGDFFLNAFTLLVYAGILYSYCKNKTYSPVRSTASIIYLAGASAALALLFYGIHFLTGDLVLNSKIVFDTDASGMDVNTITAAASVMMLMWSFYYFALSLLRPFLKKFPQSFSGSTISSFRSGLLVVLVISIYTSAVINKNVKEKKLENQRLFAQRLDTRRDQLAEYLFQDLQKRIVADTLVQTITTGGTEAAARIRQHLQQDFFNGYFTKFDVVISVFDSAGNPLDSSGNVSLPALQEQFETGKAAAESLVLLPDESGRLRYLFILPIHDASGHTATLTAVMTARSAQLIEGFPELLVSNTVAKNRDESSYSYARYSNGSLIYAGGNFPYPFHAGGFEKNTGDFSTLYLDGYDHVTYRPVPSTLVVVSRPAESFFDRLSLFSYVLLFFLTVFLAFQFIYYLLHRRNNFQLSLKQRIRTSIISLVVVSFVLIAAGTSVYIVRKYDADKNKTILSRLNAMWFAITDHLNFETPLSTSAKSQWSPLLNNIVSNFNLDFNLYDEYGNLFYSSQPKLFEKGILSTRINPEAFYEMHHYGKTQYVHAESIGTLSYAAAYAPFTDRSGNIAGYLNLPYFEKQNELNKEISGFLSALINIYLLLLLVALVLALVISSRITKPLLLIQERLSLLKLGSRNEFIEWKRNDEIGQLVKQYNQMVAALAESADKLSRSERESAWREMAQQVAHEIKNPLTPMKLSVQHLQRAWNEKSGNLDELFRRISNTMIEQIDTLSNIASEFSNFAKMPRAKNEALRLNEILNSCINLFNDTPRVKIDYHDDNIERTVMADREQLIRAFSNIIKNSIQSIPESRNGKIDITIKTENGFHIISVTDNGMGISESLQSKIFTPNFTTKTSGMGLGLAMVKSTVDAAGGSIRFETKEGEGTTFSVFLPAYSE